MFERENQVVRKNVSRNLWIALRNPNLKLRTSWMKVVGQMFDERDNGCCRDNVSDGQDITPVAR